MLSCVICGLIQLILPSLLYTHNLLPPTSNLHISLLSHSSSNTLQQLALTRPGAAVCPCVSVYRDDEPIPGTLCMRKENKLLMGSQEYNAGDAISYQQLPESYVPTFSGVCQNSFEWN